MIPTYSPALIVGAGSGLSAVLARRFAREGLRVALAARDTKKLSSLAKETDAVAVAADAADPRSVERLFADVEAQIGAPDVVVYNASFRTRGPVTELDPNDVQTSLMVSAFGAFLVAQRAASRMLPRRHGAILLTGASASVKGYPRSAPFAMGKFALRGLAQSLTRELHPQGVHVGPFVIDGGIRSDRTKEPENGADSLLDPASIADTYWHFLRQDRSAWAWEIELRPWTEAF